jgi:hypothetical protein
MLTIPKRLLGTPLMRQGGLTVLRGLLGGRTLDTLTGEARAQKAFAIDVSVQRSDGELVRGGNPARRFLSAPGGDVQLALYADPHVRQTVSSVVGLHIEPTGSAGTFTYYCRPGDFLAIHRDIVTCDVAVITCVEDEGVDGSGGKLCAYPERIWDTIPAVRREPVRGAVAVRLTPGDTAIILGGIVPHCTLPVAVGQSRVVSLLCFRVRLD